MIYFVCVSESLGLETNAFAFLSSDPGPMTVSSIVTGKSKSVMDNRKCDHVVVDMSDVCLATFSIVPMYNVSYPMLRLNAPALPVKQLSAIQLPNVLPTYIQIVGNWKSIYDLTVTPAHGSCVTVRRLQSLYKGALAYITTTTSTYTCNEATKVVTRYQEIVTWYPTQPEVRSYSTRVVTSYWYAADLRSCPSPDSVSLWLDSQDLDTSGIPTWGEMANDVVDSSEELNSNMVQYFIELTTLKSLATPFKRIGEGVFTKRTVASAWLSYHYGIRLTAQDTYAAIAALVRSRKHGIGDFDKAYYRASVNYSPREGIGVVGYRNLIIYYRTLPGWIIDSWRTMRRWGLYPTTEMAWDFIPLSFVVDWFVPIGDALRAMDNTALLASYDVLESLRSTKLMYTIDATQYFGSGAYGCLSFKIYQRGFHSTAPRPATRFHPVDFNRMKAINGTALLLQRMK